MKIRGLGSNLIKILQENRMEADSFILSKYISVEEFNKLNEMNNINRYHYLSKIICCKKALETAINQPLQYSEITLSNKRSGSINR